MIDNYKAWPIIEKFVGGEIKALHMVYYSFKEKKEPSSPLEIVFLDDSMLSLDAEGADFLSAGTSPWKDPFENKLDSVNLEYIAVYGKHFLEDISNMPLFSSLIGERIIAIAPISRFDALVGVQFLIGKEYLNFVAAMDIGRVVWGKENPELQKLYASVEYEAKL